MNNQFDKHIKNQLDNISKEGFYKNERVIASMQSAEIVLENGRKVLNFCANNYLGLANDSELINYASEGLKKYGFGVASVRFICGTQDIHKKLENGISKFLGTDSTILYGSCFDANGGLFETLLTNEDAIISDELNHASIIDGIRLCKAKKYLYHNNDMTSLENKLIEADLAGARFKMIVTDGVFSMDGIIANLSDICDLADKYKAIIMVDDSHATGFIGEHGRGTAELCKVEGRIDIYTSTLGKALGGASGGYVSSSSNIINLLRQRSRPYLFSNSLAPTIAYTTLMVLQKIQSSAGDSLRKSLQTNQKHFREQMTNLGFTLVAGKHPIIPVIIGDAHIANRVAEGLLTDGVYVVAFSYPVVPKGKARIRTQISAIHTKEQIDKVVSSFAKIGRELKIIN